MKIRQYDRVVLKNSNIATIVEVFEEDKTFLADVDRDGDTYTEDLTFDEIQRVIKDM